LVRRTRGRSFPRIPGSCRCERLVHPWSLAPACKLGKLRVRPRESPASVLPAEGELRCGAFHSATSELSSRVDRLTA
jgi:hypothetical protein